jgi:GNAT superfamily N-acetyltransferase
MQRYYPVLETDFDSEELIGRISMHLGISNGSIDFLLLRDEESGIDAGYAVVLTKSLYGYVDLKYFAVMPWFRGRGFGIQLMREINRRYADSQGIIAELSEFDDPDPDRLKKLRRFFKRFGYEEIRSDYTIRGVKANLLVKPVRGSTDLTPVAHRVIPDFYSRFLSAGSLWRMLDIRPLQAVSEQENPETDGNQ